MSSSEYVASEAQWGSDVIAEALAATGVRHLSLNPGSSYRGLHDSLVNHLGDQAPGMLVCLHEEHAIAIAHGYAKVTERPMAAAIHSNIGLMHASMAIYNAYCDRVPMLILGATGPMDAAKRRPWIDWIHTSADIGALVRPYVKWDDQPTSVAATVGAIARGNQLTRTYPHAPVYVCMDHAVQETPYDGTPVPPFDRFTGIADPEPGQAAVAEAARLLNGAERPVILMGRVSRDAAEWDDRVRLADMLNAAVITDLKVSAAFPTSHPLHSGTAGLFLSDENSQVLRDADVVLSLDWVDLGGTLLRAGVGPGLRVISASADHHLYNGWSKTDHLPGPVDVWLHTRPDLAVAALLPHVASRGLNAPTQLPPRSTPPPPPVDDSVLTTRQLQEVLRVELEEDDVTLVRVPFAWDAGLWPIEGPLDYLGVDGGGGLASGPGMTVGAALALEGTGRIAVAVVGDGDFLMGATALWTAASRRLPMLIVVANNNSYFNDEVHQQRVAELRNRPAANAHVGVRIDEPDPDLAMLARAQGIAGFGPVRDLPTLRLMLQEAVVLVRNGGAAVVDVRVQRGYGAATAASIVTKPGTGADSED